VELANYRTDFAKSYEQRTHPSIVLAIAELLAKSGSLSNPVSVLPTPRNVNIRTKDEQIAITILNGTGTDFAIWPIVDEMGLSAPPDPLKEICDSNDF
jgi:hypothetical protein